MESNGGVEDGQTNESVGSHPEGLVFQVTVVDPFIGVGLGERDGDGRVEVSSLAQNGDMAILTKVQPGDLIYAVDDVVLSDLGATSVQAVSKIIKGMSKRPLKLTFVREKENGNGTKAPAPPGQTTVVAAPSAPSVMNATIVSGEVRNSHSLRRASEA